ncbi:hypothetical protein MJO28_007992 [Puccinia striiformis f. sp. tritici]|uniref:Uncharacterized protein n=1 Tax=Puccinia striiformis f. sp. tritici TaxID=168172 RepID=A0ACC0E988_9BASI|nr:hypothetical protein MJO28_007992 [Puccinia striiformis f. sp. tritici]
MSKDKARMNKEKEKEHECKRREELNKLFKPVQLARKVRSFTQCKFSHDLTLHQKIMKKNVYTNGQDTKEIDTMDTWDNAKLQSVVISKHVVCKNFIEAIESGKYGWFWRTQEINAAGRMNGMGGRDIFTFDTTGVYGDDAYSDNEGPADDEEQDWDLNKHGQETEAERT